MNFCGAQVRGPITGNEGKKALAYERIPGSGGSDPGWYPIEGQADG